MSTGEAGFFSEAPIVRVVERDPTQFGPDAARHQREVAKYREMWDREEYRRVAPGESIAATFLAQARPSPRSEVIDFGAGTGRGALMLAILGGLKVQMLDFVSNCLDEDVRNALTTQSDVLKFKEHNLVKKIPFSAQYGYCTDVMEHIPPEDVDTVLFNVLSAARHCFFQIACDDDVCGALIGAPLHLSVHPYAWWHKKFQDLDCTIHWSQDNGSHCLFYVTAWQDGSELAKHGNLNVTEEKVKENVRTNIRRGFAQVSPHPTNDIEVCILGGGPSLSSYLEDIRAKKEAGAKIVCLNGSYGWAMENGLGPVSLIMVDARDFNARFVHPIDDKNLYLLASQCDPSAFDELPKHRTVLWHTTAEMIQDVLSEEYKNEVWYGIPGGSTVLLRAIPLLRMLGFTKFHLYGCDSCLEEDKHHAYAQPENDSPVVIPVNVGNRTFQCHSWMVCQAQEFMDLIKVLGDVFELEVYGDGLLAHILNTGAEMSVPEGLLV